MKLTGYRNVKNKTGVIFVAVAALMLPTLAVSLPDPIAPAASGRLQCHTPDTSRKTCIALSSYKPGADDSILNVAVVLVSKRPVITMETVTPVEVKAKQVCGVLRNRDIDAAKFVAEGQLLDPKQAELLREQVRRAVARVLDHEVCTAYVEQDSGWLAKSTMDGLSMPASTDRPILWVSPADGYRVSP